MPLVWEPGDGSCRPGGRGVKKGKLTPKQAMFVKEYLIDLNATQAAIRAGYSARTADRIGPELLGKTSIAEAIQKATANGHCYRLNRHHERRLGQIALHTREGWHGLTIPNV